MIRSRRSGFSLLALGVSAAVIFGMLGIAIDLGRMYIARSESQSYVDAATLTAALELDGTEAGLQRARDIIAASVNKWNFGNNSFSNRDIQFSTAPDSGFEANPASAANVRYIKVESRVDQSNFFMPLIGAAIQAPVRAQAIGGQAEKTSFSEGSFPFSPLAHNAAQPDFGLEKGQLYTIRWAANPKTNQNVCPGDNDDIWINQAEAGRGSERGYIEETSASLIREAIIGNYQTATLSVGDTVSMTGGAKQTERDALHTRVGQDSDPNAPNFASYHGNGRRLVVMPINTYSPNYTVLGFRAFFLLPANQYGTGGNTEWCAEYVGSYVQGSRTQGAGASGAYVARLVQ